MSFLKRLFGRKPKSKNRHVLRPTTNAATAGAFSPAGAGMGGPTKAMPVATAKFDYEASDKEELSFSGGDRIVVLKRNEDGWWSGFVEKHPGRGKGHFPKNYVEENYNDVAYVPISTLQQFGFPLPRSAAAGADFQTSPPPQHHAAAAATGATVPMPYAVAQYQFEASDPEELSLSESDCVVIVSGWDSEWVKGFIPSKPALGTGMCPKSYLKQESSGQVIQVSVALLQQLGIQTNLAPQQQQQAGAGGGQKIGAEPSAPMMGMHQQQQASPAGGIGSKAPSAPVMGYGLVAATATPPAQQQLEQFLAGLQLSHYLPNFVEGEVLYSDLPSLLKHEQLAIECVPKTAPRIRLLEAIQSQFPSTAPAYY